MPFPAGIRAVLFLALFAPSLFAADPAETRQLFIHGEYEKVIEQASAAARDEPANEEWPLLRAEAQMQIGQYTEARAALEPLLPQFRNSLRLRMLGYELYRRVGDPL